MDETLFAKPMTLFRMGIFGVAHGWGGKKVPAP